jgi:hypothetical protein
MGERRLLERMRSRVLHELAFWQCHVMSLVIF